MARHPVLLWTASGAALGAVTVAWGGRIPSFGGPAGPAVAGWTFALLAVQPAYPWIAHRWGTPALRPPPGRAPAVFLSRLLSSLQLTVSPLLWGAALFLGRTAALVGVPVTLACLVAGCVGTYLLREGRAWPGLACKAGSLLPASLLAADGPAWTALIGRLLLALGVLLALAVWSAARTTAPECPPARRRRYERAERIRTARRSSGAEKGL